MDNKLGKIKVKINEFKYIYRLFFCKDDFIAVVLLVMIIYFYNVKNERKFLANISHELKRPHGIYGMVQLLESSELNVDQKENVEILKIQQKKNDFYG